MITLDFCRFRKNQFFYEIQFPLLMVEMTERCFISFEIC